MDEKRRLPSWMVRKPKVEEEEVSVVTECTKPKAKRVACVKDECLASDGDSFLVKCGTKRKKREVVEKDVIECCDVGEEDGGGEKRKKREVVEKDVIECCDVGEEDGGGEKRKRGRGGREGGERGVSRKKNGKDFELEFNGSDEIQCLSSDEEDDDDLTMEDMLMIAKEFVENDKSAKGQQKPPERQCELKKKSSHVFSSMTRTSLIAPQDTGTHNIVEPASHRDSAENTSEVTLSDFKTTDDPAQDMLDLFLGPLLNKPIRKEETSVIKDVIIPREIMSQKHDPVISEKPITFAKKKSSLREAVAMLLES